MSQKVASLYSRVFIVDDDTEDQEILIEAFMEVDSGIRCFTSTNGEEALQQLEAGTIHPDLIFLDLNMPKLNGKQILAAMKGLEGVRQIPVIMYSTSFAPRDLEEIRRVGAAHHLVKPSRFDELCDSLREIVTKKW